METGWHVLQQEEQRRVDGFFFDHMIIIQDEGRLLSKGHQFIDECGQHGPERKRLRRLQESLLTAITLAQSDRLGIGQGNHQAFES